MAGFITNEAQGASIKVTQGFDSATKSATASIGVVGKAMEELITKYDKSIDKVKKKSVSTAKDLTSAIQS